MSCGMTMIAVQVVDVLAVPHARVPARVAVLLIMTGKRPQNAGMRRTNMSDASSALDR
jgi:hypothetical protein